jgi:hypothetical protein
MDPSQPNGTLRLRILPQVLYEIFPGKNLYAPYRRGYSRG